MEGQSDFQNCPLYCGCPLSGVPLYYKTTKYFSIEGGRNRKRKCHISHISPPALCTKAKVAKVCVCVCVWGGGGGGEGRICRTLRYIMGG